MLFDSLVIYSILRGYRVRPFITFYTHVRVSETYC